MVTNSLQLTCWACSDRRLPVDLSSSCCWWWLWFVYKTFPIFRTHLIKPFLQRLEKKQLKVTKCFDIKKNGRKKINNKKLSGGQWSEWRNIFLSMNYMNKTTKSISISEKNKVILDIKWIQCCDHNNKKNMWLW